MMRALIDSRTPTAVIGYPQDRSAQPKLRSVPVGLLTVLAVWQERWSQRRTLEALDDRAMHDLALSSADIHREASKPFWVR